MRQGIAGDSAESSAGSNGVREIRALVLAVVVLLALVVVVFTVGASPQVAHGDEKVSPRSTPAKKKALAKCKKVKKVPARRACLSQVNQRFLPPKRVDVRDDFFFPTSLTIRSGRRVTWDWGSTNGNTHNVMLDPFLPQPKSLTRGDFFRLDTGQTYAINFRFTRDLTKTGQYNFYCSLHSTVMRMKVKVTR